MSGVRRPVAIPGTVFWCASSCSVRSQVSEAARSPGSGYGIVVRFRGSVGMLRDIKQPFRGRSAAISPATSSSYPCAMALCARRRLAAGWGAFD